MSVELKNLFKYSLDLLRNNESITGQKALKTLGYFLNLKLMEQNICDASFFSNFTIDLRYITNSQIEEENEINKIKHNCIFSNLNQINENDLIKEMDNIWIEVLSKHPKTYKFFPKDKSFGIKNQSTFKKIIEKFNNCNFNLINTDILGEAYEEVIQDLMTGKVLGQFFTPTSIKEMMINLINPQLKEDGICESIYDPAMGTGGFLISSIRHLIKQSNEKNIPINWNTISNGLINGREPDNDTYEFANSNMLISTGHIFNIENGDSIRNEIKNKYDIVLANPPFGIDGLNYDEIKVNNKDLYIPIESSNAVSLFLQVIVYILKINGRCAIVLPNGKDLNSKTDKTLVLIRKFLMKTCDLKEVIYLESGIFTFTDIKTCVLYFEKKRNTNDVVNIEYKKPSKRSKETKESRIITFKDEIYETKNVIFYDFYHTNNEKKEIISVPFDKILNNNLSINITEYIEKNNNNNQTNQTI